MKTLRLPIPPSVNAAYANNKSGHGKGRHKTRSYMAWEGQADASALVAGLFRFGRRPLVHGPANVTIRLPMTVRGDVSNRIKALEDWMVSRGMTADDSTHQSVTARRDPTLGRVAWCEIDIEEAAK